MKIFKQLIVWQKSIDLFIACNKLIKKLPRDERFECSCQLRRASLSLPSNIAEGSAYTSVPTYKIFLERSLGSSFEVETVLIAIGKSCNDLFTEEIEYCLKLVDEIQKMLIAFINKLKS